MSLNLEIKKTGGVSVVNIRGRITLGEGASSLNDTLRGMAGAGHRNILLDLAEVSYLDSSGLGVLISSFATVAHLGGQLKLASVNDRLRDVMLITKVYTVFDVYEDVATGVASFHELPEEVEAVSR